MFGRTTNVHLVPAPVDTYEKMSCPGRYQTPSTPYSHILNSIEMSIHLKDGFSNQSVDHILEDLLVRFVINVPDEDLSSIERVFFQVEEAQWFYTDFLRTSDPSLPSMKMKTFAPRILSKCPLVWKWGDPRDALQRFGSYKQTIPVRGLALLNEDLTKVVLVKGIDSVTWSFPRGKISKDESDLDCAVREVREETGFDARDYVNEKDVLERTIQGKNFKIYLAKGVPEDFDFKPIVRNEISEIKWFAIKKLQKEMKIAHNKYFVVNLMMKPLSSWIRKHTGSMTDEELIARAEVRLKSLMGITPVQEVNVDAGRELLDILQGAKAQAGSSPSLQNPQQQYIQMSLPQHLHNVYSGMVQMPQLNGQNNYSLMPIPEFVHPQSNGRLTHMNMPLHLILPHSNLSQQPAMSAAQKSNSSTTNSKELLSILKGEAPAREPSTTPTSPQQSLTSRSETANEILEILGGRKSAHGNSFSLQQNNSFPQQSSKKPSISKHIRVTDEPEGPASFLSILGRKPPSPESPISQPDTEVSQHKGSNAAELLGVLKRTDVSDVLKGSKETRRPTASAELLSILNKPSIPTPQTEPKQHDVSQSSPSHASSEILNVLHGNAPSTVKTKPSLQSSEIQPAKPIRLAKRGEDVPPALKGYITDKKPTKLDRPNVNAGNDILNLINQKPTKTHVSDPSVSRAKTVGDGAAKGEFKDFEDFEDFEDSEVPGGLSNNIYESFANTIDMQSDEDEPVHEHAPKTEPSKNKQESAHLFSTPYKAYANNYKETYGEPGSGMNSSNAQLQTQTHRASNPTSGSLLSLLKRGT